VGYVALGAFVIISGCAQTPELTFGVVAPDPSDPDAGALTEAGAPSDSGASSDASIFLPPDSDDDDDPDAGDASAMVACGAATVTSCALCPGKPLRCTVAGHDECVSDCTKCAARTFPCLHCAKSGAARGRCVLLNAKNRLKCSDANRCPCPNNDPSACPKIAGAAQTCAADASTGTFECATCGEVGTQAATCSDGTSTLKTCRIGDADPVCN
jgi:hypothetical protein